MEQPPLALTGARERRPPSRRGWVWPPRSEARAERVVGKGGLRAATGPAPDRSRKVLTCSSSWPLPRPPGSPPCAAPASSRSSSCRASTRARVDGLPAAELALQFAELKCAAVAARDDLPARRRGPWVVTRSSSSTARPWASRSTPRTRPVSLASHARQHRRPAHRAQPASTRPAGQVAQRPPPRRPSLLRAGPPTRRSRRTSRPRSPCTSPAPSPWTASAVAFVSGIEGDHHNVVGLSLPGIGAIAELGDLAEPGVTRGDRLSGSGRDGELGVPSCRIKRPGREEQEEPGGVGEQQARRHWRRCCRRTGRPGP